MTVAPSYNGATKQQEKLQEKLLTLDLTGPYYQGLSLTLYMYLGMLGFIKHESISSIKVLET